MSNANGKCVPFTDELANAWWNSLSLEKKIELLTR